MKTALITGLLFLSVHGNSMVQPSDSTSKKFFKRFTFQINLVEYGGAIAFGQKKLSNLGNGLNHYYSRVEGNTLGGFGGFTVYYKDKIGIGFMLIGNEFLNKKTDYLNYLATTYPNYYIPDNPQDFSYKSGGISFNLSYRKYFKQFILEPKIRASIGTLSPENLRIWMKEGGSNQFRVIELLEERSHYLNNYHAMLALIYQFKNRRIPFKWQLGIQADFFVSPMKGSTTITDFYSGTTTRNAFKQDVSRWNPALGATVFVNMKFGHRNSY